MDATGWPFPFPHQNLPALQYVGSSSCVTLWLGLHQITRSFLTCSAIKIRCVIHIFPYLFLKILYILLRLNKNGTQRLCRPAHLLNNGGSDICVTVICIITGSLRACRQKAKGGKHGMMGHVKGRHWIPKTADNKCKKPKQEESICFYCLTIWG